VSNRAVIFRLGDQSALSARFLWAVLLVTIPITSSPLITRLIGRTQVSPLLGIPLSLLFLLWFFPDMLRSGRQPRLALPLLAFIGLALIASLASFFQAVPSSHGETPAGQTIRGLTTLFAGVAIFLIVARFPKSAPDLRWSLRWLYAGAMLMLVWSSVQGIFVVQRAPFPDIMQDVQKWFSIRKLIRYRVVGFAYEPSWLANQLAILYIPLWAASVARGYSAFARGRRYLSVELGLLGWGLAIHFLTLSRVGYISMFASLGVLVVGVVWRLADRFSRWLGVRLSRGDETAEARGKGLRIGIIFGLGLLLAGLMFLVVFLASRLDPRIQQIFNTDYVELIGASPDPFMALANRLRYAERVIYWMAAYRTFSLHPLLGVGVGNVGFFFQRALHPLGYHLPEIIDVINGAAPLPNAKNLWIRLLAETGIGGFMAFAVWLVIIGFAAWRLRSRSSSVCGMIGLAGLLALVAQVVEGFSVDSFALPQLWILPALVTASLTIASRAERGGEGG
jgi:O-antigen ligase